MEKIRQRASGARFGHRRRDFLSALLFWVRTAAERSRLFQPGGRSVSGPTLELNSHSRPLTPVSGMPARHFLSIKPKPQQPIDFPHKIHTADIGVGCTDCHSGVEKGPRAGIPSINICMSCHEDIGDAADPRIQALRDHAKRNEDMAWQRVYGFVEESHVRFNHAPHIRAKVDCANCHGDLTEMTVAQRVVDHTMGFCINCHKQKGASNDCLTCHY